MTRFNVSSGNSDIDIAFHHCAKYKSQPTHKTQHPQIRTSICCTFTHDLMLIYFCVNWNVRQNNCFVPIRDGWFSMPMHSIVFGLLHNICTFFWEIKTKMCVFDVRVGLWGIMGWNGVHFGWWLTSSLKEVEAGTLACWFGDSWDQSCCFWLWEKRISELVISQKRAVLSRTLWQLDKITFLIFSR